MWKDVPEGFSNIFWMAAYEYENEYYYYHLPSMHFWASHKQKHSSTPLASKEGEREAMTTIMMVQTKPGIASESWNSLTHSLKRGSILMPYSRS